MTRRATLPNRQEIDRRAAPHDLAAAIRRSGFAAEIEDCNGCGNCQAAGAIDECAICPNGAPSTLRASLPSALSVITGEPALDVELDLEHAGNCNWQSDSISVACDSGNDAFGWELAIAGRNPGDNTLTLSKIAGANCPATVLVYRNMFPWNCLCNNLFVLSRDESVDAVYRNAPCTVCVRPKGIFCGGLEDLPEVFTFSYLGGGASGPNDYCEDSYQLRWRNSDFCSAGGVFNYSWGADVRLDPNECVSGVAGNGRRILTMNCVSWTISETLESCAFFLGCTCLPRTIYTPDDGVAFDPTVGGLYSGGGSPQQFWELRP